MKMKIPHESFKMLPEQEEQKQTLIGHQQSTMKNADVTRFASESRCIHLAPTKFDGSAQSNALSVTHDIHIVSPGC